VDRHLLPEEIDLLLDGEVGFGTAPLKAHVRSCAECRAELEDARAVVRELEHLPHLSPSPLFTERVMEHVQVFVPWHVTLLDTVRGWMPRSRAGRVLVGTGIGSFAVVLTGVALWLITQLDTVIFAVDLALDRARTATMGLLSDAVGALFGDAALQVVRSSGGAGIGVALALLLFTAVIAARALRAVAAGARARGRE
jgi:hypothetical protein